MRRRLILLTPFAALVAACTGGTGKETAGSAPALTPTQPGGARAGSVSALPVYNWIHHTT